MTDLKLNLKAGNLKRILAMFMAVCLTILSVNVPAFAEDIKNTDTTSKAGTVEVTVSTNAIASSYDGETAEWPGVTKPEVEVKSVTVGGEVSKLDGEVTIEKPDEFKPEFKYDEEAKKNIMTGKVMVNYPENKEAAERVIEAVVSVTVKTADSEGKDILVEQNVVITQEAAKEDAPVKLPNDLDETQVTTSPNGWEINEPENKDYYDNAVDKVQKEDGTVVSIYDGTEGQPTAKPDDFEYTDADKALDKDAYAGDLENISVSDLDGKSSLKTGTVTVKVYDGIITKKAPMGSVVAVYSVKKDSTIQATTKVNALKTNYYENKKFVGFVSATPTMKGKKITGFTEKAPYVFGTTPTGSDDIQYVVAKYDKADVASGLNGEVTIQAKKSATIQVTLPEGAKRIAISGNDKEILASVKMNAKTGTFTFKAGKKVGTTKVEIDIQDKAKALVGKATYDVTVQTDPVAYKELHLATNTGFVKISLDKTSASKTAQLVATPGTTGVKYVAVNADKDQTLSKIAGTSTANLTAKDAKNKVKLAKGEKANAVSVSKTGLVTAKKASLAGVNIYAIQTVKNGKTSTVTVSNPVNITVKSTMTEKGFKFSGGKKFTYKANGTKIKGKVVTGYNAKKDTTVKFTVKVKGDSTDRVAVRVMDNKGRVVLNALNRQKSKKGDVQQDAYFTTVHQGRGYAADGVSYYKDNTLTVIATSPVGEQYYKQLRFDEK